MRRLVALLALTVLTPAVAWRSASADASPEVPDQSGVPTTTTTPPTTTAPATTTTAPTAPTSTTTTVPRPTTTVARPTTTTVLATTTTTARSRSDQPTTTTSTTTTSIAPGNAAAPTSTTAPPPPTAGSDDLEPGVAPPGPFVDVGDQELRPITFPVAGPITYFNDWGACRDGCRRSHQGNDLIGDRLQPLLAMRAGVVDRLLDHPTAGYGVVVRDDDGWEYHLYHVNNDTPGTDDGADTGAWRFADGIRPGATVQAGQLIAWMGDSGNSEGSVPHAHVEIHRPDGTAINPYWSLRQAQRDVNCAIQRLDADPATDPAWLQSGWRSARLPRGWKPLALTGGHPGSSAVAARMWIGRAGFTPLDGAALRAGDARFDEDLACTSPVLGLASTVPAELGPILATIRELESGGEYTAEASASSASGAYQFVDSSWAGYGGYARAIHAPPSVQDAKAAEHAAAILARNGGDVTTVPVSWYLGHVPVGAEWDAVPPYPGNHLTPREYQSRWMQMYTDKLGAPGGWVDPQPLWTPVEITTCRTVVVDVGAPGRSEYVLTLAQGFASESSGRAVPVTPDPCDPSRRPVRSPNEGLALASRNRGRASD